MSMQISSPDWYEYIYQWQIQGGGAPRVRARPIFATHKKNNEIEITNK